jgi:hypothetical protein
VAQGYRRLKDTVQDANFHLRQTQIAAQGYLSETGNLPNSLADLTPAWLPAVPNDPFGEGPLQSKLKPDALVIYSLGPDTRDDSGAPIEGIAKDDSLGDIVVRVPQT